MSLTPDAADSSNAAIKVARGPGGVAVVPSVGLAAGLVLVSAPGDLDSGFGDAEEPVGLLHDGSSALETHIKMRTAARTERVRALYTSPSSRSTQSPKLLNKSSDRNFHTLRCSINRRI